MTDTDTGPTDSVFSPNSAAPNLLLFFVKFCFNHSFSDYTQLGNRPQMKGAQWNR